MAEQRKPPAPTPGATSPGAARPPLPKERGEVAGAASSSPSPRLGEAKLRSYGERAGAKGRAGTDSADPATSRDRDDRALLEAVGTQVRALRQALNLTASEVAQAAGLSVAMLSKIENGQTSPSLATLQTLATALNVPMTAFFARFDQKRDATYVKAGQGLVIDRRGTRAGHRYELLGHSLRSALKIEPFLITLDDRSDSFPVFQHAGYEFIYMLSGVVTYRHGDRSYLLEPGDSLFFDAEAPHGPEELRQLPARYLSIIATLAEGEDKSGDGQS